MNYNLENVIIKNQLINLCLPKDFNSDWEYSLYLVFDGNELLTKENLNILNKNKSKKIFIGLNNDNNVIRFNNLSTYHNKTVKELMIKYFPELKLIKNDYLGANGQQYLEFIKNDLLNWIINNKKIKISDLNLLGCSMGAYFSLQLLYLSNLTFKKVYLFSPSIWFNENILDDLKIKKINNNMELTINLWVGLKEPKFFEKKITTNYYQNTLVVKNILETQPKIKVNFFIDENGGHGFKWWINFINNHQELW